MMLFSHIHHKQFTQPELQHGVYHLSNEENAIFQLKTGWSYYESTDDQNAKILASVPARVHSKSPLTFIQQLHVATTDQMYSLDLEGIEQPFELWVDGKLYQASPMLTRSKVAHFYVEDQTVELKLVIIPTNDRIAFLQTPLIGQMGSMQVFLIKQFVIVLLTLVCVAALGIYFIGLYFSKQKQNIHLQIGMYFLLVSGTLFLSMDGLGLTFLPFPPDILYKLKLILGLLTVFPLYLSVASLNNQLIVKAKVYFFLCAITVVSTMIFMFPLEMTLPFSILIWSCLIWILLLFIKGTLYVVRNKLFELRYIFLINTLFSFIVYLGLRVYYNVWGTDLQTNFWLIIFSLSTCIYLTLHQNQLVKELESSKVEAIQSKISFFNAQIKPHFLYNALSTIMALCYTDNIKAAQLLGKFSTYLRLIFENNMQNEWISLEKELTLIDAYIEIEKARFPAKINYKLEIDDYVKALKIPTLFIQPFVENSIRHGLFNKEDTGNVHVKIEKQLNDLVITIRDNGVGMTPQELDNVLRGTQEKQGIGILNVVQRLHFIQNSHFEMKSSLNEGTFVLLKIPIQS